MTLRSLTPRAEYLLQVLLVDGDYKSPDEILEKALELLLEHDTIENIREGIADAEAGHRRPAEEVFAEIREKHGWAKTS